ncbi:MAG: FAD-dependent thymidylate synthase [Spirochaetes bacterium]|nr:FAD-dependent thymidylate synthase [Spirochaetota bacterium]
MKANVQLLRHTPNPEEAVATAARLCYSPADITALTEKISHSDVAAFIRKLAAMNHYTPFEHVSFTFGIEGISRVTTHELVRHRLASYSQQSQRYIKEKELFTYITPPAVDRDPALKERYDAFMREASDLYQSLVASGVKNEDARFVLPNAKEAKIIVTMNARELMHFFNLRCCTRAQWEIRAMADEMLRLAKQASPALFEHAGASCETLQYCPEGEYSCGRYPTLAKLTDKKGKNER